MRLAGGGIRLAGGIEKTDGIEDDAAGCKLDSSLGSTPSGSMGLRGIPSVLDDADTASILGI
eukprot:6617597-Heterocapsa_arctica.AAC.1